MKPSFIIFLDFDGVVKQPRTNNFEPACVHCVNALANRLDAKIVISSSWRAIADINRLNIVFENRIIGSTPSITPAEHLDGCARYAEVQAFLEKRDWKGIPWLALDDDANNFPAGAPVYVIDSKTLITRDDVREAIRRFGNLS